MQKKTSISIKVLTGVLAISTVFTLFATSLQLLLDYKRLMDETKQQLSLVDKSFIAGLTQSLWDFNQEQMDAQFEGILAIPGISFIELTDTMGVTMERGHKPELPVKEKFSLNYANANGQTVSLGSVSVYADKKYVYDQIMNKITLILGIQFFKTFAVSFVILWFIRKLLTKPIISIGHYLSKLQFDSKPAPLEVDRGWVHRQVTDEIDSLITITDKMSHSLYQRSEEIRSFQTQLENLVDQKTRNLRLIFSSIQQGIMTIDNKTRVQEDYSSHLENIFDTKEIKGKTISDLIFSKANLPSDEVHMAESALTSAISENEIQFEINKHLFPQEIMITVNGIEKYIELYWDPLIKDSQVESIMISIRDITEVKKLREETQTKNERTEILEKILELGPKRFLEGINYIEDPIKQCLDHIDKSLDTKKILKSFALLHTAKGISRSYGYKVISTEIHELENELQHFIKLGSHLQPREQELFTSSLASILRRLDSYKKLNSNFSVQKSSEDIFRAVQEKLSHMDIDEDLKRGILQAFAMPPAPLNMLKKFLKDLIVKAANIATELSKESPTVHIEGYDQKLSSEGRKLLSSTIPHLVRNSLDHGIEYPKSRLKQGKSVKGKISVCISELNGRIKLEYSDDGSGINLAALRKKHQLGKDISDQDVSLMIFQAQVTTAQEITEISGRGIGMDAILNTVKSSGGHIRLEFTDGQEFDDTRAFKIILDVPKAALVKDHQNLS